MVYQTIRVLAQFTVQTIQWDHSTSYSPYCTINNTLTYLMHQF